MPGTTKPWLMYHTITSNERMWPWQPFSLSPITLSPAVFDPIHKQRHLGARRERREASITEPLRSRPPMNLHRCDQPHKLTQPNPCRSLLETEDVLVPTWNRRVGRLGWQVVLKNLASGWNRSLSNALMQMSRSIDRFQTATNQSLKRPCNVHGMMSRRLAYASCGLNSHRPATRARIVVYSNRAYFSGNCRVLRSLTSLLPAKRVIFMS